MEIGRKIAQARREKNLTQEQLAELMDVTRQTVSRWESQAAYPEMEKLVNLAGILEVSCDYLLNDRMTEQGKPFYGVEPQASRLLQQAKGRTVQIQFYDDSIEFDIGGGKKRIIDFDGAWAYVEYKAGKKTETKLIPISSIASIKFEKEEL